MSPNSSLSETDAFFQSGNALFEREEYLQAIEQYRKACEIDPRNVGAYNNWGLVLAALKQYDRAIEKYHEATQIDPRYARAYGNWAGALAGLNNYAEALPKYLATFEIDPKLDFYTGWLTALDHVSEEQRTQAVQRVLQILDDTPDFADAWNNWGNALYGRKRYAEAIEKYQKAAALDAKHVYAHYNWGLVLAALKQYDQAVGQYEQAAKIDAEQRNVYFDWGNTLAAQFRYAEAIEKFQQALAGDSEFAYAMHNIAHYLARQGKYRESYGAWERARRLYTQGKEKARESLDASYFYYSGWVVQDVFGDLTDAEQIFKEGLALDPNHVELLIALVNLYLEMRDEGARDRAEAHSLVREHYRKAERILRERIEKERDAATLLQLGDLLLKTEEQTETEKERYSEAERLLLEALKNDRESTAAYTNLGVLYSRKEDFKRAAQFFEEALRLDPDNLAVWSNLAEVYLRLKLKDKAATEYGKILKIAPEHMDTRIGMGEVLTAMAEDGEADLYEQAISHYTQAIKLAESRQGSKRLKKGELASVYYSRGYARAKAYEALKIGVDESLLHEALDDFKKCRSLDPDHFKAARALEKLEKRLRRFTAPWVTQKLGPWLILIPALFVFGLAQSAFFFDKPKTIEIPSYITLTFSALAFTIIGLYLPQILKLKVAGIELEKSAVEQISTSGGLGIRK